MSDQDRSQIARLVLEPLDAIAGRLRDQIPDLVVRKGSYSTELIWIYVYFEYERQDNTVVACFQVQVLDADSVRVTGDLSREGGLVLLDIVDEVLQVEADGSSVRDAARRLGETCLNQVPLIAGELLREPE